MLAIQNEQQASTRDFAVGLLVNEFRVAAESIPEELLKLNQDELESKRTPTDIDYVIRKRLWLLVENAQKGLVDEISGQDVFRGACSRQVFHQAIGNPLRMAWILTPPMQDHDLMEAGVKIGLRNLVKFVSKEPTAETASAFIKALEVLLNRVHGPVVQRIDARHAHAHMKVPQNAESPEDVQRKLSELKTKLIGGS